ncbi:MAG: hypothetical protein D6759_12410 [Chloroflexi bacterium]|nr:MAG: hypothetical protein D6759_12410 [Chloroflexota bacterium]
MKRRHFFTIALVIVLCAVVVTPVLADPIVEYKDTKADLDFVGGVGTAGGASYVRNGAFDEWMADAPKYWTLETTAPTGSEVHWAKADYADPNARNEGRHNYALALFVRNTAAAAPAYGIAHTELGVSKGGYYWVTVHVTAWGANRTPYNSVAWYAIYPTGDPGKVPESAWRELYPDTEVCANKMEQCNHLARKETVYIEPGSHLFLKGAMKFPVFQAWTVWAWDDISVLDLTQPESMSGWIAEGVVTWDKNALR